MPQLALSAESLSESVTAALNSQPTKEEAPLVSMYDTPPSRETYRTSVSLILSWAAIRRRIHRRCAASGVQH